VLSGFVTNTGSKLHKLASKQRLSMRTAPTETNRDHPCSRLVIVWLTYASAASVGRASYNNDSGDNDQLAVPGKATVA